MTASELDRDPILERILAQHAGMAGPLLPILHAVQAEFGHVSARARRHGSRRH